MAKYGSVTVNTGLRIGNCLGNCGNQDNANLANITLEKISTALLKPWANVPVIIGSPGITADSENDRDLDNMVLDEGNGDSRRVDLNL